MSRLLFAITPQARLATHSLMCDLDNMLEKSSGQGLLQFRASSALPEREQQLDMVNLGADDLPFPMLSFGMDQGGDNWAASFYLQFCLHLRLVTVVDVCHRTANDCKLAAMEAGLWVLQLLMVPVFNLHWGPWKKCKWYHDAKSAIKNLIAFVRPGSKPFSWLAPRVAADMGRAGEEASVWAQLPTMRCFTRKGPHCRLNAWFGWVDAAENFHAGWHARLAAYVYCGITGGWLSRSAAHLKASISKLRVPKPAAESKAPTAESASILDKARSMCRNMMHVSLLVMADPRMQQRVRLTVIPQRPFREYYGKAYQRTRSTAENAAFMAESVTGTCWLPYWNACHETLYDSDALAEMGLKGADELCMDLLDDTLLDQAHPFIVEQDLAFPGCSSEDVFLSHSQATPMEVMPICMPRLFS